MNTKQRFCEQRLVPISCIKVIISVDNLWCGVLGSPRPTNKEVGSMFSWNNVSVPSSALHCSINKMGHESNCCSIHKSYLSRASTCNCEKKTQILVISSVDFSQYFTPTTKGNIFDPAPIARLKNFEYPVNLLCLLFFVHCFFLSSTHHYQIGSWRCRASPVLLVCNTQRSILANTYPASDQYIEWFWATAISAL